MKERMFRYKKSGRNLLNMSQLMVVQKLCCCFSDEDESRFTGPNAAQILKCVSSDQLASTTLESPMKDVIESLLDALIVKYSWNNEDGRGLIKLLCDSS